MTLLNCRSLPFLFLMGMFFRKIQSPCWISENCMPKFRVLLSFWDNYIQSNQFSNGETKQSRIRAHCWRRSLHFECARVSLLRICSLELSCILADIRPFEALYWFLVEWFTVCSETKQTDCRHKALMQMAARMQHLLHTQSNWSTLKATELTESLVCVTPAQWFCASDLDLRRKKKASARHHSEDQHPRKFCLNTAWN